MNLFFTMMTFFTVYIEFNNISENKLKEKIINIVELNSESTKEIEQFDSIINLNTNLTNYIIGNNINDSIYIKLELLKENQKNTYNISYYPDIFNLSKKQNKKITVDDSLSLPQKSIKIGTELLKILNKEYKPFEKEWIYDNSGFEKRDGKLYFIGTALIKTDRLELIPQSETKLSAYTGLFLKSLEYYLRNKEINTNEIIILNYKLEFLNYKKYDSSNSSYTRCEIDFEGIVNALKSQKEFTEDDLNKISNLTDEDLEKINKKAMNVITVFGEQL